MYCDFDNDAVTCPRCGKQSCARNARSNCTAAAGYADLVAKALESFPQKKLSDAQASGPGTELSKLLKRFGIEPTPTCACRAKAAEMDAWGPDECSKPERIEEVVAVMREEAKARGLPFLDAAGRVLVKRAIANARRASSASLS
jgi:hypothetical protein